MLSELMTEVTLPELDKLLDQHRYPRLTNPRILSDEISHNEKILLCLACITGKNQDICDFIVLTDYRLFYREHSTEAKFPLEHIYSAEIQVIEGSTMVTHIQVYVSNDYTTGENLWRDHTSYKSFSLYCHNLDLSIAKRLQKLINSSAADAYVRVRSFRKFM